MDYLFRWIELRFLKGEQGLLFELPRPAQPQREVTTVVEGLGQVAELGDAPVCQFCGSLMVRNASCYRAWNVAAPAVAHKLTNWRIFRWRRDVYLIPANTSYSRPRLRVPVNALLIKGQEFDLALIKQ